MKKLILILCCMGLLFTSCADFLNKSPYVNISAEGAVTDASTTNYSLLGIYNLMQNEYSYGRAAIVLPDAATSNIILSASNSNRYINVAQWTTSISSGEHRDLWYRIYQFINAANRIIAKVDDINATEPQKQQFKAEALTIRALGHFLLVSIFSQAYPGGQNSLGVPYMEISHTFEKPARDDVQTVYTKIIADLTEAINLFNTAGNPSGNAPYRADLWSAKAILGKVYMHQLDYVKAKPVLRDIIDNSGYSILANDKFADAWGKRYDDAAKTEFMLAIANNPSDYGATTSLGYIYIQGGYGDLRASQEIFDLYATSDIRKSAYFKDGTGTAVGSIFVNKYPSRENSTGLSDNPIMRLSDVYLLYAEACAYTGDEAIAITHLDMIIQRADLTAATSTESGTALQDKIFLERRKELAFEGQYLFDLKRYHMAIKSGYRADGQLFTTIPYPSNMRAFPIPDVEMDANPNMVQNPS